MFWKLFKIHTMYDPFMDVAHSGPGPGCCEGKRKDPKALDPIENPGKLNTKVLAAEMEKQRIPFAHDAHMILSDERYAQRRIIRADIDSGERLRAKTTVQTNGIFLSAIIILCTWGVMSTWWDAPSKTEVGEWTPLSQAHITSYAKYFQVPKTEESDRAIADSRKAGSLTETPPPMNLPHLQQILIEIAKLGTTQCVVGDFRHFFYQHPISRWLSTFFGIKCGDVIARMLVLPMGWSWSPRIAQCSSWSILLHHDEGASKLGVDEKWGDDPPSMVKLRDTSGNVVGLIFVWIDNFIVFHKHKNMRDLWFNRITENCKKFNVKIKDIECTSKPTYLGIHFEKKPSGVVWRHDNKRTVKWQEVLRSVIVTPRDVAKLVGVGIWHHTVSLSPLLEMRESIDIMRRVSRVLFTKSAWDKPLCDLGISLTEKEQRILRGEVEKALLNRWVSTNFVAATETIYAVTDAAKEDDGSSGAGWVFFNEKGEVTLSDRLPWPKDHLEEDIHILELAAVSHCIDRIPQQNVMTHLVLGCDNTVAVAALIKGYSPSFMICDMIQDILRQCKEKRLQLNIFWIPSDTNAADPPSRNRELCKSRNIASWQLLRGAAPRTQRKGKRFRDLPYLEDEFELAYEYTQSYEEAIVQEFGQ